MGVPNTPIMDNSPWTPIMDTLPQGPEPTRSKGNGGMGVAPMVDVGAPVTVKEEEHTAVRYERQCTRDTAEYAREGFQNSK